jgi:hypothetical protein
VEEQVARLQGFGTPGAQEAQPTGWVVVPYFGVDVRVAADPYVLEIALEEFMDLAADIDETSEQDEARAYGVTRRFSRGLIHPADFPKWWTTAKTHRQGVIDQAAFAKYVIESVTGHPTGLLSGSSAGQQETGPNSGAASWQRVKARLEDAGRPDLAVSVLLAQEARGVLSPA